MTLSGQTIKNLREIINEKSQYRSGPELVDFFNKLGFHDRYGDGFPSRWLYTEENLKKINGTSDIDECIKTVFAQNNFIDVAKELGYIDLDVQKFSHVLQNFRNYIHPYQQLHEKFSPNIDTAKLCVQVIKIAINQIGDLKNNNRTN